jgi:putative transposase
MANRPPVGDDEWYHCYNRGVDKRQVFMDERDSERFLILLYLCNDASSHVNLDLYSGVDTLGRLLARDNPVRSAPLVQIGAYALMHNHVHFVVKQYAENGLSRFMQKVFTGYTMYFNKRYDRTGALFAGSYKSKHIANDIYFKQALQYVLLNPVEIFEPNWKKGKGDLKRLEKNLRAYTYSSLRDFIGSNRPEASIVDDVRGEYFNSVPSLKKMLSEARLYHRENQRFLER